MDTIETLTRLRADVDGINGPLCERYGAIGKGDVLSAIDAAIAAALEVATAPTRQEPGQPEAVPAAVVKPKRTKAPDKNNAD